MIALLIPIMFFCLIWAFGWIDYFVDNHDSDWPKEKETCEGMRQGTHHHECDCYGYNAAKSQAEKVVRKMINGNK